MTNPIIAWGCPVCKKFDWADAPTPLAKPEHIPYRGVDLGTCKGKMIPLCIATDSSANKPNA